MGVYSSIYAPCPECSGSIEFQSKAIYPVATFSIGEVPTAIAEDIEGDLERCDGCGFLAKAEVAPEKPDTVAMTVT